jgi:HD-like signal output (HDOD) protein
MEPARRPIALLSAPREVDFSVSLYGSSRCLGIPDLFAILHQNAKTGLLSLVSRDDERGILFHRGDLVYATAGDLSRRLGSFLVGLGFLDPKELARLDNDRGWEGAFLGQELLRRGAIKKEELNAAIRKQLLDNLDDVLLWEDGAFHFDEWSPSEIREVPTDLTIRTQSILLEAVRRFDESRLVRASFPDLSVVLEQSRPLAAPGDGDGLDAPARGVLALIQGPRPVNLVLRDSMFSPYETSVLLTDLMRRGYLREAAHHPIIPHGPATGRETPSFPILGEVSPHLWWVFKGRSASSSEFLVKEIARDPLLTAKALRHFAASGLTLRREEFSIPAVLARLGSFRARAFLIPEVVRSFFFAGEDYYWKGFRDQAIVAARTCRDLAQKVAYPFPEEVYLAGLLANLGMFLLVGSYPERYRKVFEKARQMEGGLLKLEEEAFGLNHAEYGAVQAEKWKFPDLVVQAMRFHHRTHEAPSPLLDLVALGNWIARTRHGGIDHSENEEVQVQGALRRFRLKRRKILALSPA